MHSAASSSRTPVILVTGVSGSGKSTVGSRLAARLGWIYAEADSFHSRANIAKMAAGHPLDDTDREPWLAAISAFIDATTAAGQPAVVTCSALKRAYRESLRRNRANVRLVFLDADVDTVRTRLNARKTHFFPTTLLASQYDDLELPEADEHVLQVSVKGSPDEIVDRIIELGIAD